MFKNVHLFISAGPDLELEREALGKAIAQMPISLGWTIRRTAGRGLARKMSLHFPCKLWGKGWTRA